jgi:hypothetical protein
VTGLLLYLASRNLLSACGRGDLSYEGAFFNTLAYFYMFPFYLIFYLLSYVLLVGGCEINNNNSNKDMFWRSGIGPSKKKHPGCEVPGSNPYSTAFCCRRREDKLRGGAM